MDKIVRRDFTVACPAGLWKASQDLPVGRFKLHIGNALAQTDMGADAKGQMRLGICALDVECIRIWKDGGVAIGRAVVHQHLFSRADFLAADVNVLDSRAAHLHYRAYHAHCLIYHIGHELHICHQPGALLGKFGEQLHGARERIAGGVIAGKDNEQPGAVQTLVL